MSDKMKDSKIREFYNEIAAHPEFANELSDYQRAKVIEFADNELLACTKRAISFLEANKDYNYPKNTMEDERLDYWLSRSNKFKVAKRVKRIAINQENVKGKETDKIYQLIVEIAQRRTKDSRGSDYDKIIEALTLYHKTKLTGKEIAQKVGISESTFSTWKTELDNKIEEDSRTKN